MEKKKINIKIIIGVIGILLIGVGIGANYLPKDNKPNQFAAKLETQETYLINDNDFLKVNGTKFVKKGNGNAVVLRGYNLGEWLSRAISLMPVYDEYADYNKKYTDASYREYADNNVQINYLLTKRFGSEKAYELNEIYYNNFITSEDIKIIADTGANLVRVPVEWSYFVDMDFIEPDHEIQATQATDMDAYSYSYTLLTGSKLKKRLSHLDWIVNECRKEGIYVIFDLHVVDGGQNNGGIRDKREHYNFFNNVESQENAIAIWKIIADRFKNNPGVAAYELLNEPASGYKSKNPQGFRKELIKFYDEAYATIREIDNDHIIIMESAMAGTYNHQVYQKEGNIELITLPTAAQRKTGIKDKKMCPATECKWTNVAYSIHDYFPSVTESELKKLINEKVKLDVEDIKKYNVPLYVGETNFQENNAEIVWEYAMNLYDSNLISYSFWSYKVAKSPMYGVVYNLNRTKNPNYFTSLLNDDEATIRTKFGKKTSESKYDYQTKYVTPIKNNFYEQNGKAIVKKETYECKGNEKIISTIRIISKNGGAKLSEVVTSDESIASVKMVNQTGVICTGTVCQTIQIICKRAGTVSLTAKTVENKLFIQYNGNGGEWKSSSKVYSTNEYGTVISKSSDGKYDVYTQAVKYGDTLPLTGLINYNGAYFNWVKKGYKVPSRNEYIIKGTNITLDQNKVYDAETLASYANCDLLTQNCLIQLKVNYVASSTK